MAVSACRVRCAYYGRCGRLRAFAVNLIIHIAMIAGAMVSPRPQTTHGLRVALSFSGRRRIRSAMGDRSKADARKAEAARQFEEMKRRDPDANVVRCRSCKKSQREVPVMVEMGGFVFCSEGIEAAYSVIAGRKPGR